MSEAMFYTIAVGGIVAVILFFVLLRHLIEKARTAKIKAIASRLGFSFTPLITFPSKLGAFLMFAKAALKAAKNKDSGFMNEPSLRDALRLKAPELRGDSVLADESFFQSLRIDKIRNHCFGTYHGIQTELFDKIRTVTRGSSSSGSSSKIIRETLLAFRSREFDLPWVHIRPRGLFEKGSDEDSTTYPSAEFQKSYVVATAKGAPPSTIQLETILNFTAIGILERNKGLKVRIGGDTVVIHRDGKRVKPTDIEQFLEQGRELVRALSGQ